MISSGLAWLQEQLAEHAGQEILYHAGRDTIEIDDAVMGDTEYESTDLNGVTMRAQVIDWLIAPDRLVVGGQPIEPEPGHQISQTIEGVERRFEVQSLGSEPCWRWSGPSRDRFRIHTREIPSS